MAKESKALDWGTLKKAVGWGVIVLGGIAQAADLTADLPVAWPKWLSWISAVPELVYDAVFLLAFLVIAVLWIRAQQELRVMKDKSERPVDRSSIPASVKLLRQQVNVGDYWKVPGTNLKITVVDISKHPTKDANQIALRELAPQDGGYFAEVSVEGFGLVYPGKSVCPTTERFGQPKDFFLPARPHGMSQEPYSLYYCRFGDKFWSVFMVYVDHINPNLRAVNFEGFFAETSIWQQLASAPLRSTAS